MSLTNIAVEQLSKTFGRTTVLQDVDFEIDAGDMVALIGPSGSGKSTLLRLMVGLTRANREQRSRVTIMDRAVQQRGKLTRCSRAERCRVGYIFQQYNLVGRLSVLTNVLIGHLGSMPRGRALLGRFNRQERLRALEALSRVGLESLAGQRANTLSGGQMQRVAIARALVQDADIILADEPIASLDPRSAREVMKILQRINEEDGRTVLVTLHQVEYAREFCRRAIALKQGRLYYDDSIQHLTDARLQALYDDEGLCELFDRRPQQPDTITQPAAAGAAL
ncbi:phosphonate ABC transporter ATP-binding protein [Vreelandella jeotgali]|uniref:phosphonate ABC transporter ATP-binding protein n=1 Tax=Vreelandella jeotgali TaxID=553386 RepID=UPI00034A0426|nr:phosphonate ABC transporter ATP-binding protein [Halomonas jeotgali]